MLYLKKWIIQIGRANRAEVIHARHTFEICFDDKRQKIHLNNLLNLLL